VKRARTLLTCDTAADDETVLAVMREPLKVRDAQAAKQEIEAKREPNAYGIVTSARRLS
jgi:hypothetical protein